MDILLNGLDLREVEVTRGILTGIDVPGAVVEGVISCVVRRVDASVCFGLCRESEHKARRLAIDSVKLYTMYQEG